MTSHNVSGVFYFLTFFCIFQPLNEFFHLLEEKALPLGNVGVGVPLQDGLFAQDVGCEEAERRDS